MVVTGEHKAQAAGWSLLGRAVTCVVVCLCLSLFVPLAHGGFIYHLEDASPYGGIGPGGLYSIRGMNDSGVVVGTYVIVPDQPSVRAYASFDPTIPFRDLDLLFNGNFGYGPTGERVKGVDTEGRVYGSVFAPHTSLSDTAPIVSDFVTPGLGGSSYDLAPSGTFANLTLDNNLVSGIAPPDISTVDNGTGWTLLDVEAENAQGQIAGLADYNGRRYVYRLSPIKPAPGPSSLFLFSVGGLAVLGVWRRRHVRQTPPSLQ